MAEVGLAYVSVAPSFRGFDRKLSSQVGKSADVAGNKAGRRMSVGFGRTFAKVGGALAVGSIVKQSVQLEASFSKTMKLIAASTGAPASAIGSLSKLAMRLGAATQFSANEAADAMLELGKAGISTSDIMGGAASGTLLLASAGSTSLATAATIASNAMNTFNLRGKDMASIAAALAGGANASSASVESLGQALSQVGPGARNAGLNLQQTVGVLSAFDSAGIKGSDAGTSLKTMLSRLVPQTKKASDAMKKYNLNFVDSKGNFDSITTVADKLQKHLGGLTQAQRAQALQQIFGSDATRAATVLMNQGAAGISKYIKATRDRNAAEKMSKAAMSGTAGALERLKGNIETTELALGQALAPTIQKTANFLSNKALPAVSGFIGEMQSGKGAGGAFADTLGQVVDAGKGIAKVSGKVIGFFDDLPSPVKKAAVQLGAVALLVGKINKVGGSLSPLKGLGKGGLLGGLGKAASFGKPVPVFVTNAAALGKGGGLGVGGAGKGKGKGAIPAGVGNFGTVGALAAGVSFGGAGNETRKLPGLDDLKKLDAQLAHLTFKDPAAGAAAFNTQLQKSGLSVKQMNEALPKTAAALDKTTGSNHSLNMMLQGTALAAGSSMKGVQGFQKGLLSLPRGVQTKITTPGFKPTSENIKKLKDQYDLTPKSLRTLVRLLGGPAAIAEANRVQSRLDHLNGKTVRTFIKTITTNEGPGSKKPAQNLGGLLGKKKRASGGPIQSGQTYLVGERGPELFTSKQAGFITPNNRLGGSATAVDGAGGGSSVFHIYDVDDNLLGSMTGIADERYYANGALTR